MMRIVFLGSPGVGKGTYVAGVLKKYKLFHVYPGEILREEVRKKTKLGNKIKRRMRKGKLVGDVIVNEIVKKVIKGKRNLVFDGYPRTLFQAQYLQDLAKPDLVIKFTATVEKIVERLSKRRVCKKCGRIFHLKNIIPKVKGICDGCGGKLFQRKDDKPRSIKKRLKVYEKWTLTVSDYYEKNGMMKVIDANSDNVQSIVNRTIKVIEKIKQK